MRTLALYGLLAVLLIAGIYLLAAWVLPSGEQIAPPVRDEPIWTLPAERALAAADVADVRLPVALRGYRFAETDLLLDRLVEELRARDEEIVRLRGPATPPDSGSGERIAKHESAAGASPIPRWTPSNPTSPVEPAAPDQAAPDQAPVAPGPPTTTPAAELTPEAHPAPKPRRPGVRNPQPAPPTEQVEHVDQGGHDG